MGGKSHSPSRALSCELEPPDAVVHDDVIWELRPESLIELAFPGTLRGQHRSRNHARHIESLDQKPARSSTSGKDVRRTIPLALNLNP